MIRVICWDTSTRTGAIAAVQWTVGSDSPEIVAEFTLNVDASAHSEQLLWGVHQVLKACRWTLSDLSAIGVGEGPGSFTGIRIGLATARTLASVLSIPLVPFSSLIFQARSVTLGTELELPKNPKFSLNRLHLLVVQEAAKGEWYVAWGKFWQFRHCVVRAHGDLPGLWGEGVQEELVTADHFLPRFKKSLGATGWWLVSGIDVRSRSPNLWLQMSRAREVPLVPGISQIPSPRIAARMAWEAYQAGILMDPKGLLPRYLRESDAERNLSRKQVDR